ncbi:hypothetical protein GTA08_BOTSDO12483 [Botryosphaeria dothidea]|uniref:Diphthine--ammonia ligase n=1 Tax=Botryosphaeria dothidea TaxID=55169 RepID=A0A8H4J5G4_9PEZI|nr:hypothetical protein GTA08_BOTSDO02779 [Botryosphaeria dothidea]KAF4312142.1 hypothetical protein GTA08_BOTSDO12483 [Botryosphaeria dothidea]
MSSKLHVVALVSGGKDSLFSILHCLRNGHDVVALANLHPPQTGPSSTHEADDINSFMYQTVGHSIIPLYEKALKLPLYRQPILGHAVNSDKDYHHHLATSAAPLSTPSSAPRQVDAVAASETSTAAKPTADAADASFPAEPSVSSASDEVSNTSRNDSALPHQNRRQAEPSTLRVRGETPDDDDDADETESLLPLLRKVLAAHPEVNAVCTGAILSTYQRTRVESVCARLGLVPLGYLWQYPSLPPYADASLLRDMDAVGQDARIIKVASGGIDSTFLWQNVAEKRTVERLKRAAARFGGEGAVLGEGGEFETAAVDGPSCVWKAGRIEVDVDEEAVVGEGGSAVVKFKGARVVEKAPSDDGGLENLRIPDLFDIEFEELGRKLLLSSPETAADSNTTKSIDQSLASTTLSPDPPLQTLQHQTILQDTTLTISNLTVPHANNEPLSPTSQLEAIKSQLLTLLSTHSATSSNITSTTLLLRSMSLFTLLNPIYGSLFTSAPNPPARVTIACGSSLPLGTDVSLSCTVNLPHTNNSNNHPLRRGLHVQSRSYWAPANIGPYSQAIAVPASSSSPPSNVEIVHLAGQIPLVPASMDMVRAGDVAFARGGADNGFGVQTVLALQHLWRVGRVMGVRWWACGAAFVSACGDRREGDRRAVLAREAWRGIHEGLRPAEEEEDEDEGDVDVWDLKFGNRGMGGVSAVEVDGRANLPNFKGVKLVDGGGDDDDDDVLAPPCVVAEVLELPRATDIEWTSPGLANCKNVALRILRGGETGLLVHETKFAADTVAFYAAGVADRNQVWDLEDVLQNADVPAGGRIYTVYMAKPLPQEWLGKSKPLVVPCSRVWGPEGKEVAAAVMMRYSRSSDGS